MAQFDGTLTLTPTEAYLDLTVMEIDDNDCDNSACRRRRARDYFENQGLDTGSPISVTGVLTGTLGPDGVLTIVRE